MLGSLLLPLTVSATVLLLPAAVGLHRAGQHAHVAPIEEAARRARLASAAVLVGLGSVVPAVASGASPSVTSVVAAAQAASVLAWSRSGRSWAVRGVVVWSLLATGTAGLLAWLAHRILTGAPGPIELLVASSAWLVLLLAVVRLLGNARARVGARATRYGNTPSVGKPARPVPWLVTALVAGGVAAALGPGTALDLGRRPAPVAGSTSADRPNTPKPSDRPAEAVPSASGRPTRGATRNGGRGGDEPRADATRRQEASATQARTSPAGAPAATTEPAASPSPRPTEAAKTPGYAKDKPNRPEEAPAPGPRKGGAS